MSDPRSTAGGAGPAGPAGSDGSRIRVAVLFGGTSGEYAVSCASGAGIVANLDRDRFEVVPVRVDRSGVWVVGKDDPGVEVVDVPALLAMTPDAGPYGPGAAGESLTGAVEALRQVDVAFPAFHGRFGEDGTVQAFLQLVGVPYVGNRIASSAVAMDKQWTKTMLTAAGLLVADDVVLERAPGAALPDVAEADRARLGLPVFVKPAREGSSIGVSRVRDWAQLPAALETAFAHDDKVLVEAAVVGREVDIAVLEHADGSVTCGPPLEIVLHDDGVFDYEAKYASEPDFRIPAELDEETTARLHEQAVLAFRVLGCAGLIRADFFLRDVGGSWQPVVNEVNTFPGFTAFSQYPRIWAAAGLDYPALLTHLVTVALAGRGAGSVTA